MYGYIYKITNLVNNKIYIGKHKYNTRELDPNYISSGVLINKAIQKYGIDNFLVELIDTSDSLEGLNIKEIFYIKKFDCYIPNGYNMTFGGDGNSNPSQQIKEKISQSIKKKHAEDLDYKNRISESQRELVWYHNGKIEKRFHSSDIIPEGWIKGRLIDYFSNCNSRDKKSLSTKQKISNTKKKQRWYNNGIVEKMLDPSTNIPCGFTPGRLKKNLL